MTKEENRARMPMVTAIVDEFREVFGPGVRVTYAREGDVEVGKPMPKPARWYNTKSTELTPTVEKVILAYAPRRKKRR